ncbi:aromatic-ring-hydroxylating dioxygenase subunit beta [Caballeronia cordobensis]|uniref:Aromatic-ring-hydroxylating dioxygenase subunit beta n=1 Tax=Caballeronia cordobensis TaxID=1353886 RepID=A0A158I6A0_CABCO|nr:aromatic-ring-hydroxylating dioxygenase subunit beta [Caballeronia cordobensis]SAL52094.1 aromatic-ring-hydroxylating dioxygenase subunit beta [Caballeronia cordobensis]
MNNAVHPQWLSSEAGVSPIEQASQFLYHEAALMDAHRFDEWLALWHADGFYWVPCNTEDLEPDKSISLIYESRRQLDDRVYRLKGRHAHAQSPRSRLLRVVSNVTIESANKEALIVHSNFVLGEVRSDRQETLFGRCRHVLALDEGAMLIREKKVFLLNNDTPMSNLTFLI